MSAGGGGDGSAESNETLRPQVADAIAALLAVAGGVTLYAVQSDQGETGKSLTLQLGAAAAECVGALFCVVSPGLRIYRAFAVPRYLIALLFLIEILESVNGFGEPDTGSPFRDAAATGALELSRTLQRAAPTQWYGLAAESYEGKIVDYELTPAEQIAAGDQKVADTLARQAYWVRQSRDALAALRAAVGLAIPVAICLAGIIGSPLPGFDTGPALRKLDLFGLRCACFAALGALAVLSMLIQMGVDSKTGFDDARSNYHDACST